MTSAAHRDALLLPTAVGHMEVLMDLPSTEAPLGVAMVAHPQPLLGGSAQHKVPAFLARALRDAGWVVARPNFRGVGRSSGAHDHGEGEALDLLALARHLRLEHPGLPLGLVGFSFGAFVQSWVAKALADQGCPAEEVCLTGMPAGEIIGARHYAPATGFGDALVVHGEWDERVPLSSVMDWARSQSQPVVVVPGADHFFSGKLPVLRQLVLGRLAASCRR